jgi:hypothetical protein
VGKSRARDFAHGDEPSIAPCPPYFCISREGRLARQGDDMIRTAEWIRAYRESLMTDKKYGFIVVILGLVFVLAVFVFAIFKFNSASDVTTTVTSVGGVIGTIVGAFFGLQLGAAGKEKVEQERNNAQRMALMLAGKAPTDKFESLEKQYPNFFKD